MAPTTKHPSLDPKHPGRDQVYVCCKLPHGLWLEVFKEQKCFHEMSQNEAQAAFTSPRRPLHRVLLNGANSVNSRDRLIGVSPERHEYGLTPVRPQCLGDMAQGQRRPAIRAGGHGVRARPEEGRSVGD
jgi:hypothetical protein